MKEDYTLKKKLLKMLEDDLLVRQRLIEQAELHNFDYHSEMEEVHLRNGEELKKVLDEKGWPTITLVGKEASEAAWIILQHAISRPQLMRYGLRLLKEACKEGEADPRNVARTEDRICFFEGRGQIYGTNFDIDDNGDLSPTLIADEEHVNKRRESVGLPPLEKTILEMRVLHAKETNVTATEKSTKKQHAQFIEWTKKVGWRK